jgi:RHS repeat-associated protein
MLGSRVLLERRDGAYHVAHRTITGSVAAATDDEGGILRQEEFWPYGQTLAASGTSPFELYFHGLRRDDLIIAGSRAYDAESGRWLARDPLLAGPGAVLADDRLADAYQFAFDSPFRHRDPLGLWPDDWLERFASRVNDRVQTYAGDVADFTIYQLNPWELPSRLLDTQTLGIRLVWGGYNAARATPRVVEGLASGNPEAVADATIFGFQAWFLKRFAVERGAARAKAPAPEPPPASAQARPPAPATSGGAGPVIVGQTGEAAVRGVANIGPKVEISINGRIRIPDGLTTAVLSEVKNVKYLGMTRQLRDFAAFARQAGLQFELWVRTTTKLSGPLQAEVTSGRIKLRPIP